MIGLKIAFIGLSHLSLKYTFKLRKKFQSNWFVKGKKIIDN